MDYEKFFSDDVFSFFASPVREIFKSVDLSQIYSFAGGYPHADTFPISDIKELASEVLDRFGAKALQYGGTQGVPELREAVALRAGVPVERVQISSSSQQGIDVTTRVLVNPGDVVLTSNPSYLGAIQSFRSYRADVRGIAHESDLSSWENSLRSKVDECIAEGRNIKFFYIIPDFQNPSGETLTLDERKLLVSLAEEYDFLILEDSPYRELRYEGESVDTIYSLAPDRTILLGSFSKIFAPGFRLGWIIANESILQKIYVCKQSLDLCPPVMDQYMAALFLSSGKLDANLEKSIAMYKKKRDHMLELLEKYMPEGVSWTHPEGGLFLYLTLPQGFDSVKLYPKALAAGVAYVAGSFFCTDGSGANTMRMNFSFLDYERMEPGIKLLAELLKENL